MSLTAAVPLKRPSQTSPIKVMICDDSLVIRGALSRMLTEAGDIQIVARANNGAEALEMLKRQSVDVMVLDIEMPVMDGIAVLPQLLKLDPKLRVIMASTLTTRGADIAMQALRLGASDYIPKPSVAEITDQSFRLELLAKIRGQARLRLGTIAMAQPAAARAPSAPLVLRPLGSARPGLLAIGSSTGGPQALFTLIKELGRNISVPVILTQHMPRSFTPILAEHLTKLGGMKCAEAISGETLKPGQIYLAPGDQHLCIDGQIGNLRARLTSDAPENFCRPAADPMLRTASLATGGRMLVVMLTGMGHDGLAGTKVVIAAGGSAIAQDEATSVVWGMPGAIAQAGLCHAVLPLPKLASKIIDILDARRT